MSAASCARYLLPEEMRLVREPAARQPAPFALLPPLAGEMVVAHAVDDDVAAAGRVKHVEGVEPARGVVAVAEDQHHRPPHRPLPQGEGREGGVVEPGRTAGPHPGERLREPGGRRGRRDGQPQLVGEGHQTDPVTRPQRFSGRLGRGPQLAQGRAAHAPARVQDQQQGDRDLFDEDRGDVLPHAVVQDREVGRGQPPHRIAPAGDEHVDGHRIDPAAKGLRGRGRRPAADDRRQQQREEPAAKGPLHARNRPFLRRHRHTAKSPRQKARCTASPRGPGRRRHRPDHRRNSRRRASRRSGPAPAPSR